MRIGEYQHIIDRIKKNGNLDYLILSQCTPCCKIEAIRICEWFSEKIYKNKKFILVEFKFKRGFGGWKIFDGDKRPYIQLPKNRMYHPKNWKGKLRIGIVLHELSHAICSYGNPTPA